MAAKRKHVGSKSVESSKGVSPSTKRKVTKKATTKKQEETSDMVIAKPETSVTEKAPVKANKRLLLLALVLALAGGLYLSRGIFFAALVNGSPVTRLEVVKELEKSSGKQTLDNIVTKKLILQELQKKNITVSDDDVNKEIDSIKKSLEGQGANLDQLLLEQGQTMESLRENVKIQKGIEKLFESEVTVSDEEIKSYYEDNKAAFGEKTFDELKEDIKKQLFSQKLSSKYGEWVAKVKSDAKIQYFVNY